jgi:hypothetical protein
MTAEDDGAVDGAQLRCLLVQAVRDREVDVAHRSENQIENDLRSWMLAESSVDVTYQVQMDYQATLRAAADRFAAEGRPNLAIIMYATAVEHWINGMLALGLERRGERLQPEAEKGSIKNKLCKRWPGLFGSPFPAAVKEGVLRLADARNEFVHHKWPSRSEDAQVAQDAEMAKLAAEAPGMLSELDDLEDQIVFKGQHETLDRVLDRMSIGSHSDQAGRSSRPTSALGLGE